MASSGGWDWAPFSNVYEGPDHVFTRGIWKSVYLLEVDDSAAITSVVPQVYYQGPFPTSRLEEGDHAGFLVSVRTFIWAPQGFQGTLVVTTTWGELFYYLSCTFMLRRTLDTSHTSLNKRLSTPS